MPRSPLLITALLALAAQAAACRAPVAERGSGSSAAAVTSAGSLAEQQPDDSTWALLVERLSEPAGYFDTDNLISNETSYLHVLGAMRRLNVRGGAYIGVGPDQNFAYIAAVRPSIAFIVDIRRGNLLEHLLFRSIFAHARNRVEYLCLLFGKPAPKDSEGWSDRTIEQIVAYLDRTPTDSALAARSEALLESTARGFGLPLTAMDMDTVRHIRAGFVTGGLDLRFTSANRAPRPYYPTYRKLLLERDLTGRQGNFLARESDFQFIRSMEAEGRIVPVVGDLSGDHALAEIAKLIGDRGEALSAFYVSNVEFYLMREGSFDRYARNVAALPRTSRSVIIRSVFGGRFGQRLPQSVPGYYSTQLLERVDDFVRDEASGAITSYGDLITKHSLDTR